MKCPLCKKGVLVVVTDISYPMGKRHILVQGSRCSSCKEEFFDETSLDKVVTIGRSLGVWGEAKNESTTLLHRKLSRSGRGTVLRIPTDIEKEFGLKGDENITISTVGKRKILIEIRK